MGNTGLSGRGRRAVAGVRGSLFGRARRVKALAVVAGVAAMVVVGLMAVPDSQAATPKQAAPAVAAPECRTFGHSGIPGVLINETNARLTRTFVEHGPGTGFFNPEPPAELPAEDVVPWCVGSNFGVEAMQVTYRLPDHPNSYVTFQAYYAAVVGSLETACTTNTNRYGCAAEKVGPNFVCSPYVGCVGPLRNKEALKGVDVVFRIFPQ